MIGDVICTYTCTNLEQLETRSGGFAHWSVRKEFAATIVDCGYANQQTTQFGELRGTLHPETSGGWQESFQ